MAEYMLTTVDNPYDPFKQFDEWMTFDEAHGYFTMNFLARVLISSEDLSEADQDAAIDAAIDEVLEFNISGLYKKVSSDDEEVSSKEPRPS